VADDLDTVTQQFEADVTQYTAAMEDAAATAQEFAAANEEARAADARAVLHMHLEAAELSVMFDGIEAEVRGGG
jgi:hypothetical protein